MGIGWRSVNHSCYPHAIFALKIVGDLRWFEQTAWWHIAAWDATAVTLYGLVLNQNSAVNIWQRLCGIAIIMWKTPIGRHYNG
jgi:hypothetical protein